MPTSYLSRKRDAINFDDIFRAEYSSSSSTSGHLSRRSSGKRVYVCIPCGARFPIPANAVHHARQVHDDMVVESQGSQSTIESTPFTLDSYVTRTPTEGSARSLFNKQRYHDAVVGILTRRRAPFSAVEWEELKEMALACNPAIADILITTRYMAMKIIDSNYELYLYQLRDKLQESRSMIHITTDLWTSPHRHAMLAICAQWVDSEYQLQKALLGMPECPFTHSGEAQASLIMEVLNTFSITRIGYHVGDNATSNDTCLISLSQRLEAELQVCWNVF